MALFRSNKPIVFDPYGSRRRKVPPVPRWLLTLLLGAALGAGGLHYVQRNHLPKRLSPAESAALLSRTQALEAGTARLQAASEEAARQLASARTEIARLGSERDEAQRTAERLRKDLALFEQVLPPDPRGGTIGVRAARLANERGRLDFHVLLTRRAASGKAVAGVMELVVAGQRADGRRETVTLDPVGFSLDRYQHLQGSLPLPQGFTARQATIRVLDGPGGRMLGMRVINVS